MPTCWHPARGFDPAPGPHHRRHTGNTGEYRLLVDLLLQTEGLEPQQPVPLQPGHRRLPGSGQPAAEDRCLDQEILGIRGWHVPNKPLPDVYQPLDQHRTHDCGGYLQIL